VTALDYDRTTLDPRDLSYHGQLAELEASGWELDEGAGAEAGTFRYLRRHRRIGDIDRLFEEKGRKLRFRREADGTWTAEVLPKPLSGNPEDTEVTAATPLEAAETAWERFG